MALIIAGISHKTAPVRIREQYAFPESDPETPLRALWSGGGCDEAMIVSTCNRVEVLAVSKSSDSLEERLRKWLADAYGESPGQLAPHLYLHCDTDAIRHVFRVASSLDSMIVGEPQILGQVKDAYRVAAAIGTAGPLVNRLMQKAFSVAKRVRTETGVAEAAVSVSSVAVQLAERIFDTLEDKEVVLLGAGEMIKTAARILKDSGTGRLRVLNRTVARAQSLAKEVGGEAASLDRLPELLPEGDIVLSSVGDSPGLVTAALVRRALEKRGNRAMFIIDIAVPRNVEPAVNDLDSVYLYNLDDLAGLAEANARSRAEEAHKAEEIVIEESEAFSHWLHGLDAVPAISQLTRWGDEIRRAELEKAMSALGPIPDDKREVIEKLSNAIVRKLLHKPVTRMKQESESGKGGEVSSWVRDLFNLREKHEREDEDR
ncbi:MAG: glutamyl-tRNA reductase [Myxococcota bacterium]